PTRRPPTTTARCITICARSDLGLTSLVPEAGGTNVCLARQSGLHQPFAQMLIVRRLLIVKRREVALDGKRRLPLKHFLRMGSGSGTVSQLCRRCSQERMMRVIRRR